MELPFHKKANALRRLDEAEAPRSETPEELKALGGGFSARQSRARRRSKSARRRAETNHRRSRRMRT